MVDGVHVNRSIMRSCTAACIAAESPLIYPRTLYVPLHFDPNKIAVLLFMMTLATASVKYVPIARDNTDP